MRGDDRLDKSRKLEGNRPVGVKRKRGAIEDQFVLATELIDVKQRKTGFGDARDRNIEADIGLVAPVGRAVGHQQNLSAGLDQTLDHVLVVAPIGPGILADRQPKPHAAKAYRSRHGPGREHALFVEHAIVWQVDLEADRRDPPGIEQRISVVEFVVLDPWRADEHAGSAIGGFARQRLDRGAAGGLKSGLEDQILGRIAGDEQFGKGDEIGAVAGGRRTRLARALQVAGDVADDGIELRHGDGETIGLTCVHAAGLAPDEPARQWVPRQPSRAKT